MIFSHINSRGEKYFLNALNIVLKQGYPRKIFFFTKDERPTGIERIPFGYDIVESPKTKLPLLKKTKI